MRYIKKDIVISASLLLMLLCANIYTLLFADTLFSGAESRIWYLFVLIVSYTAGLLLMRLRTFFIVAGVTQMVVLPIEVSSLYLNGEPVSMPYISWILSTNSTEAGELIATTWWLIPVLLVVWGTYGVLTALLDPQLRLRDDQRLVARLLFALSFVCMLIQHRYTLDQNYTAPNRRVYTGIYAWSLGMKIGKVFPYDIYLQTFRVYKHKKETESIAGLSDFRFGISPRTDSDSALYVLMIGEAARFQNFSLNGIYPRETNPMLSQEPNLLFFTHAYTEGNATNLSLPLMITRAQADEPIVAYHEKTVAGAFQEAGYKTAWLSADASPIQYMQHILPTLDTAWIAPEEALDEVLLAPCKNLVETFPTTSLVILHTKGSHLNYQDRYPESFAVFEPCLKPGAPNGRFNKELMTNTYDNSIRYTDYLLDALIRMLDASGRCACLIYMPDHGENLCDDERKLWVHGSYEGSLYEYHVPLIVWYSSRFQDRYPEKVAAMKANRDKRITDQVLFHTLCDMAQLQEVAENRYCLTSDSLEDQTDIRVLNGKGELIPLPGR